MLPLILAITLTYLYVKESREAFNSLFAAMFIFGVCASFICGVFILAS